MARSAPLAWFGEDVFYSSPMVLGKYKAVTLDPASLCIKRMSMVFMLWGKKHYFYLLYFHCLFSYDCTVCQQPRGHFDACFDAMVYCVAQLSLWFSFQIRAGILGEKKPNQK